ncbi:hypothetical protein [Paraburkholderia pallida]|uniref:Uncharacterized protein n=1 Tax=Paraburkholderia pallida TaxID=2547399 RepID=A0A4P7D0L2_9BURK|nr:hypothetical protein [Paraburkholderia pallida]QBR02179.1 hypothetical protein E1956_34290 [Paraburkholderia pallida]
MNGVVAVGDPLGGANLTIVDSTGKNAQTTSSSNGNYTISLSGLTPPLLIVANDPSGTNLPMYSVATTFTEPAGAASGAPLVANVTPLTTAVSAELTSDGNPADLVATGALAKMVTAATVTSATSTLNSVLAKLLSQNGLNASFDPIAGPFTPNHTGADAVIDSVVVTPAPAGGLQITSIANMGVSVPLSQSTTTATVLSPPPYPVGYLSTLLTQLGQCLSGTTSACASAIDAGYLEYGVSKFQTEHPGISASGTTITGVTTLAYFPGGTFPNVSGESALVHIKYTSASGAPNYATTLVQNLSNGNWDVIGNQVQYNIVIATFLQQYNYLDATYSPYSQYETGLQARIPTTSPNPSNMASVSITGPGIHGTAWMEPRAAVGNTLLSFTPDVLTAPPTGGQKTNGNTSYYRWSWQPVAQQGGKLIVPTSNLGQWYGSAPIATANLPVQYELYTVTLYDSTGKQIGTPQTVINSSPPMTAAAGQATVWPMLSNSTASTALAAGAASAPSLSVTWSTFVNNQPIGPLVGQLEVQAVLGSSEVDGYSSGSFTSPGTGTYTATVTAGVDENGVQECSPACPFPALSSGGNRNIELLWSAKGISYNAQSQYDN